MDDSADVFANSSNETVTENLNYAEFLEEVGNPQRLKFIDDSSKFTESVYTSSPLLLSPSVIREPCNSTDVSIIANHFMSEACNIPFCLYCPFCPSDFGFEFLLKEHIQKSHPQELKNIVRCKDREISFYSCVFCHAKFYVKELLPKHIVKKHPQSVADMCTRKRNDSHAQCYFCPQKFLDKHIKRLAVHIEKKHYNDFKDRIFENHHNIMMTPNDLKSFDFETKDLSMTSVIRRGLVKLSTIDGKIKPILKRNSKYSSENKSAVLKKESSYSNNTFNNSFQTIKTRNNARRKLRFDLPESPENARANAYSITKNVHLKTFEKKKKSNWFSLFKNRKNKQITDKQKSPIKFESPKKNVSTTPVFSTIGFKNEGVEQLAVMQFKCGLCFEGFDNNAHLLEHLRRRHRGIKLQAQYRCGECHAKFYRNSFLVRHCWYHHTPLCLKSKSNKEQ
uniref:C2H2-type domain-containing protein n=1 Tax=Clastoptera arizonana TaxID=38151 RepID=A0A1B6EFP1_9HEMI